MAHERKLVALLFMVFLLVPDHGWGHAYLVKSSPALQEVLIRPPTEVQLWFNERLEPAYSHVCQCSTPRGTVWISPTST
jgi:methionine-rich copper-binding protein CopC